MGKRDWLKWVIDQKTVDINQSLLKGDNIIGNCNKIRIAQYFELD